MKKVAHRWSAHILNSKIAPSHGFLQKLNSVLGPSKVYEKHSSHLERKKLKSNRDVLDLKVLHEQNKEFRFVAELKAIKALFEQCRCEYVELFTAQLIS